MAGLLAPWSADGQDRRLRCVHTTCLRRRKARGGVAATHDDGQVLIGDMAVLATDHVQPAPDAGVALSVPWSDPGPIASEGRIVIVGTGLTMIDCVLSIWKSAHRGQILSILRRGVLPRDHAETRPLPVEMADLPLGSPLSALAQWLRGLG